MSSPDHDILHVARRDMARQQLRALLVFLAAGLFLLFLAGLVLRDSETLLVTSANVLLLAVIGWLRNRDQLNAAALLATLALLVSALWATWTTTWGLVDSSAVIFVAAAVFAALLLPGNQFLAMLGLIVVTVLVVGFRGPLGLAEGYDAGRTRGIDVALVVLAVIVTASWVRRQNAMLWDTLHRAVSHERDLAESNAELQRRQQQVVASEQRWRSLVTAAPDWIVQLDRAGTIVFANRPGFFGDEPLGRALADLVPEADRGRLATAIGDTVERGVTGELELDVAAPTGRRRGLFHVGPLRTQDGADGAIVLVSDVTARHELQQQFLQTQKLESIGQLAGGIAHDFNNLLTVISGHADLAQMKIEDHDPVQEDLEIILRTCDNATSLTRQILAFSRRQPLRPVPMDLAATISKMHRMLERLIGEEIRLEESLIFDLPPIEADPGSVEQVVMNLAVNARDAIRDLPSAGDRTISIGTRLQHLDAHLAGRLGDLEAGSYVELTVRDTGIGMDEALQSRVFEPFFTTKQPGRGTGLGLATVYGIVAQSGGAVRVVSAPGRGTTFFIYWPTTANEITGIPATVPDVDRLSGDERLLVVEDDRAVRELAESSLRRQGYHVITAGDGQEALDLIAAGHTFDLVVTDVVMPGVNGFELRDRLPDGLPVLLCSGHTDLSWLPDGALPAPELFLPKPYGPHDLARKVRRLLNARAAG